jgi:hypothetical protein
MLFSDREITIRQSPHGATRLSAQGLNEANAPQAWWFLIGRHVADVRPITNNV